MFASLLEQLNELQYRLQTRLMVEFELAIWMLKQLRISETLFWLDSSTQ